MALVGHVMLCHIQVHVVFFRLFGHSGACTACGQSIPASEMVMRTHGNVYHLKVSVIMQLFQHLRDNIIVLSLVSSS